MAQTNTARSNASMDDILSSIRQIIAETEDRAANRVSGPSTPIANDQVPPVIEQENAVTEPIAAAEPSLSDVFSRLDEEIGQSGHETGDTEKRVVPVARVEQGVVTHPQLSAEESKIFQTLGDVLSRSAGISTDGASDPERSEESADDTIVSELTMELLSSAPVAEDTTPEQTGRDDHLVSQAASLSVSQSFAQLDAVMERETGKALSGQVETMLKPLLQEWLDDNLPTIVERLVRAEIERLARGEPRQT